MQKDKKIITGNDLSLLEYFKEYFDKLPSLALRLKGRGQDGRDAFLGHLNFGDRELLRDFKWMLESRVPETAVLTHSDGHINFSYPVRQSCADRLDFLRADMQRMRDYIAQGRDIVLGIVTPLNNACSTASCIYDELNRVTAFRY